MTFVQSTDMVNKQVIDGIMECYRPSAVVLQCGADSLAGDKLGCFNLTMHGHAHCVQHLRKHNTPLILLGGGGYTVKNVARTWTYETACALGIEDTIDHNLPWNEYFEWFGPRYRLEVAENNMDDLNVKDRSLDVVRCALWIVLVVGYGTNGDHSEKKLSDKLPASRRSRQLGCTMFLGRVLVTILGSGRTRRRAEMN
jgi:hypothetical protein